MSTFCEIANRCVISTEATYEKWNDVQRSCKTESPFLLKSKKLCQQHWGQRWGNDQRLFIYINVGASPPPSPTGVRVVYRDASFIVTWKVPPQAYGAVTQYVVLVTILPDNNQTIYRTELPMLILGKNYTDYEINLLINLKYITIEIILLYSDSLLFQQN